MDSYDHLPLVRDARVTIRRLRMGGWSVREAGNMAAYLSGLTPCETGWTLHQIESVLALRWAYQETR